jgi:hypothetical protein
MTAKQTTLDLDLEKRNPVMHAHAADFTAMDLGHMVGDECRVIRCPACQQHCIAQERFHNWRFVHSAIIQSTTRRAKFEPVVYCELDHEKVKALAESGAIIRNREGQILAVK